MASLSRPISNPEILLPAVLSAALLATTTLYILRNRAPQTSSSANETPSLPGNSIPPPHRTHIPALSVVKLPYPPDVFPGGRDVNSPYGSMRVFEWGPVDANRHVVLISGDTTPCPILGNIAWGLVEKGCRVMMFDIWGRGLTSTPLLPSDPHSTRTNSKTRLRPHSLDLFTLQIHLALTSSPISWTGTDPPIPLSIIGFSLGGSIAMSFASHSPNLVSSIVLLAPGGILRLLPPDYPDIIQAVRWIGVDNLPAWWKRRKIRKTLGLDLDETGNVKAGRAELDDAVPGDMARELEQKDIGREYEFGKEAEEFTFDVSTTVRQQFDHHGGFVDSFISTIGTGPTQNKHDEWKKVLRSIIGGPALGTEGPNRLRDSKLLLILGSDDDVVLKDETEADVRKMFEELGIREEEMNRYLVVKEVEGGHGFPVPRWREILRNICEVWQL